MEAPCPHCVGGEDCLTHTVCESGRKRRSEVMHVRKKPLKARHGVKEKEKEKEVVKLTPREELTRDKNDFERWLEIQLGVDKEKVVKYSAMVKEMNLENFIVQVNESIRPFVKWGKTDIAVQWILYNCDLKPSDISEGQLKTLTRFFIDFCQKLKDYGL